MIRIALIGLGSVGKGVVEMIHKKDLGIIITGVADSRSGHLNPRGINISACLSRKKSTGFGGKLSVSAADIIKKEAEFDVLVEVSHTNALTRGPASRYIRAALSRKKHGATSNKGPVALHFNELRALAEKKGVCIRYEVTVAGAIPIMHTLEHGLGGNRILALYGVLNGTCNFVLTRMAAEGLTYEQVPIEAREMGYAEADPTYDMEGIEAAIKLVILANTIWGYTVKLADIDRTEISLLTPESLAHAEEPGCTIRLIAEAIPRKKILRFSPRILKKNHPLVVYGSPNALTLKTDIAKEITMNRPWRRFDRDGKRNYRRPSVY